MTQAVRILHGSSAALASALPALSAADDLRATPSFTEADTEGHELAFISVRVFDEDDWEGAVARVEAVLPAGTEYFLTSED